MWKIVLLLIFVSNAFAKKAPIFIELQDYGRHQRFPKKESFELKPRNNKIKTVYSVRNKKINKDILFKPISQEITNLLKYQNDVSPNCHQGTRFSINYKNKSNTIDLCTSPFLKNIFNNKIRRWITFLRR